MKNSYLTITDQFCGAGGSSQGARALANSMGGGLEIKLALNHWKLAIETHNTNFPDTIHDCTDISAADPRRYPSTDILITSPECFPSDTLILTKKGLIHIQDLQIGDLVLTHKNRWRKITNLMSDTKNTVKIKGHGHRSIETTLEHPFLVRKQTQQWNNEKRDYDRKILDTPSWVKAVDITSSNFRWATPNNVPSLKIPVIEGANARTIDFSESFWWMVGRWLGDGSVRIREDGSNEITICCGKAEVKELEALNFNPRTGPHASGNEMHWRKREIRTSFLFECTHDSLSSWLVDYFGKGAHDKTIPSWVFGMKREWRESLLKGYVSADGHNAGRYTSASSVSKKLALGIKLLVNSLGFHPSFGSYHHKGGKIEGRPYDAYDLWIVRWENNKSQRSGIIDGHHSWTLVKNVLPGRTTLVFNLSVEEDESYIADGIVVHNCTNHSLANGKKKVKAQMDLFDKGVLDPTAERSRATMWDVPRFAEYHNYRIIIVENVVDARKWLMWDAWLLAMDCLGYNHKCCYFNSMHFHPTPQSRDRMYIVFWKKGNKAPNLEYSPKAFCHKCGHDIDALQAWKKHKYGKFKTQYNYACPKHGIIVNPYYYAAFNAIDWSDFGKRIGDRSKPLSDNTIRRISYGLKKYSKDPFQVISYSPGYCKSMADPTGTITSNDHHGICVPFIVNDQHSTGVEYRVKSTLENMNTVIATSPHFKLIMPMIIKGEHTKIDGYVRSMKEPLQTQTTRQSMSLVMSQIIELNRTGKARPASKPLSTILTSGSHHGILMPFIVNNKGKSNAAKVSDPLNTVTSIPHHGVVTSKAWNSFISYYYGCDQASHITDPIGTVSTKDRHQLITHNEPRIEDCYYRMIKPKEIKIAMAFDNEYVILGSGKDQVKQCGNAVTPPVMRMILERCIQTLN